MLPFPIKVDEEVAAEKFRLDFEWLGGDRARQLGLQMEKQDRMWAVVKIHGVRGEGQRDDYYVRLGAEYYDKWPPTAAFVKPNTWELASAGTRWLPRIQCQGINWFGLHAPYNVNYNRKIITLPQLLCFTFTAEYYMVPHSPPEESVWRQGYHTLAATLSRLAEVMQQPHYRGPSGS
ncbi:MAG: hypothetical protein EPN47_18580 [Acidobacteria bacterium]|nr:MAG: hypothetical protein EPN47_18580 [Acidobacteriota bacterium]